MPPRTNRQSGRSGGTGPGPGRETARAASQRRLESDRPAVTDRLALKPRDLVAIRTLAKLTPRIKDRSPHQPATAFPACRPPDARSAPEFVVPFRRTFVPADGSFVPGGPERPLQPPSEDESRPRLDLAGFRTEVDVGMGLTASFEQTWRLREVGIGDLSSTLSLAPGELLTIEVQTSQRRRLEEETLRSTEQLDAAESTHVDKEVVAVARSASETENWKIDGSGSFSLGFLSLGASGGYSRSVTNASQASQQRISEATRKSAHSLKTLHKVTVRGVTETFVANRQTRVVRNPYRDRTLALNVFQLIKRFSVETALGELRPALVIRLRGLPLDNDFIVDNEDFLRTAVFDPTLVELVPIAIQAAQHRDSSASLDAANREAREALALLFREPSIFDVPANSILATDPNHPVSSFDATPPSEHFLGTILGPAVSGLRVSVDNDLGALFTTLGFYYALYGRRSQVELIRESAFLAKSLADSVAPQWSTLVASTDSTVLGHVRSVLGADGLTEVFRRLSGFLAFVNGRVAPLLTAAEAQAAANAENKARVPALTRLRIHLSRHQDHYLRAYLEYLFARTAGNTVRDLARQVLASDPAALAGIVLDLDRTYVDGASIVVPGAASLDGSELADYIAAAAGDTRVNFAPPEPARADIEVPTDGIHLEVASGACVLADVPPEPIAAPCPCHATAPAAQVEPARTATEGSPSV